MILSITPAIERPTRRSVAAFGPHVLASVVHLVIVSSVVAVQALIAISVLRSPSSERR